MTVYFIFNEEDDNENDVSNNENSENIQSDSVDNVQTTENDYTCTPVYTETGEYVCAESLIIQEEKTTVEIEKTEEQQEYDETVLTTLQAIEENQQEILKSEDNTIALELYESMDEKLENINNYFSVIVGLYFVGWIISTFNTWRRSNKN